jgi:hypothetical protein
MLGLASFLLSEGLAFVQGSVRGSIRLYDLTQRQVDAYREVTQLADRLMMPYQYLWNIGVSCEVIAFLLVIASAVTLRMKKQSARAIHFASSLAAGLFILLSKILLIYREGRAIEVLAQLPTLTDKLYTYSTVEQQFTSAAGFWASPTYTILAAVIGFTVVALLMSATLTSWSYDVAASVDIKRISSEPTSIARTDQSTKFCRMCGLKIPIDSKFCEGCGAMLSAPDTISAHAT